MTKRMFTLVAASLVAAFALASVPADAADVKARIPFDFKVNGKTLTEGNYTFSTNQSVLMVRGYSDGALVLTNRLEAGKNGEPKAVFHKYGNTYILAEIWLGSFGRTIPEGRRGEREASFERVVVPLT